MIQICHTIKVFDDENLLIFFLLCVTLNYGIEKSETTA